MKKLVFLLLGLMSAPLFSTDHGALRSGPMLGHVDIVEATIWAQTDGPADVAIRYWRGPKTKAKTSPATQTTADRFYTAKVLLTDLKPETTYQYQVLLNGKAVTLSRPTNFTTQPLWKYRKEPPEISFALGSCLYVNDPEFDRPGKPYGDAFDILESIPRLKPDFMLWLGDNTYFRESDFNSISRLAYRHSHTRAWPGLQTLLSATAHYAIWDDHDYGPNDSDRGYSQKDAALDLFKMFWANPQFGTRETPGTYGAMTWGDLDFFFLDNRFYRAPNKLKEPGKSYLGEKQLQWLKDNLISSHATFKFVVNGNQVTNVYSAHESYAHFAEEHASFMRWLNESGVEGVVFLSGDRHFSELLKTDRAHNYPLYELTSSPLTSGTIWSLDNEANNPLRVPGMVTSDRRNFSMIRVTGPQSERALAFATYDQKGNLMWEHKITRAELRVPMPKTYKHKSKPKAKAKK